MLDHSKCKPRGHQCDIGPAVPYALGESTLADTLCGVPVQLSPLSFYQVNTLGAERLYGEVARMAQLVSGNTLLDLYCGAGTIGLSMAAACGQLVGVEIVPEAVENARANAARMGAQNARFLCADAASAAQQLLAEGLRPDVVVLDPPRKGCDEATLSAVATMAPQRVVMVSCNAATAARDAAWLAAHGYAPRPCARWTCSRVQDMWRPLSALPGSHSDFADSID